MGLTFRLRIRETCSRLIGESSHIWASLASRFCQSDVITAEHDSARAGDHFPSTDMRSSMKFERSRCFLNAVSLDVP